MSSSGITTVLEPLRERLNDLDNTLYALIKDVERELAGLRLGVPVSMKLGDDVLWFDKHNKAWRLLLVHEDGSLTMLCDSPREVRAQALAALPLLLESAVVQMKEMIAERERVLAQTQVVLETIKG